MFESLHYFKSWCTNIIGTTDGQIMRENIGLMAPPGTTMNELLTEYNEVK